MKKNFYVFLLFVLVACLSLSLRPVEAWDMVDTNQAHQAIIRCAREYFEAVKKNVPKYISGAIENKDSKPFTQFPGWRWFCEDENGALSNYGKQIVSGLPWWDWIETGGHNADVYDADWIFLSWTRMGLRHFYNPFPEYQNNSKCLTDGYLIQKALEKGFNIVNPHIDAIAWATTEKEHQFNWYWALKLYKAGLEQDFSFSESSIYAPNSHRDELFGGAFRALGETLHHIGDMTLPCHVRNDAHAKGDGDILELTIDRSKVIAINSYNPPTAICDGFGDLSLTKTPQEVMETLAKFTSYNFFSSDTIYGFTETLQEIRPDNIHFFVSPRFDLLKKTSQGVIFNKYSRDFSDESDVPLVRSGVMGHFITPEMAIDQAEVLLPRAIYGCAVVIDQFFPTMFLQATGTITTGGFYLTASLTHDLNSDPAWKIAGGPGKILFKGTGELQKGPGWDKIADVTFTSGNMTTTITNLIKGNVIRLVVNAGARKFTSNEVVVNEAPTPTPLAISGINPFSVTGSTSAQIITLTGANFQNGLKVFVNSGGGATELKAGDVFFDSQTQARISLTTGIIAGNWTIKIVNPDGTTSNEANLQVTAPVLPPTITQIIPNPVTGSISPQSITIAGSNFSNGLKVSVYWTGGSKDLDTSKITVDNSSQIRINITTMNDPDTWTVKITNPDGLECTSTFPVIAPVPTSNIASVNPAPVVGSTSPQTITLTGSGFVSGLKVTLTWTGDSKVLDDAKVVFDSSTKVQISITTMNDADNWTVKITNPDGSSSNIFPFQVIAPPSSGGTLSGTVKDAITRNPLNGVNLKIYDSTGNLVYSILTDDSGIYSTLLPTGTGYRTEFTFSGYLPASYHGITIASNVNKTLETVLQIDTQHGGTGIVNGNVTDSTTGNGISDVTINLRKGINMTSGAIFKTGSSQTDGSYQFSDLEAEQYTAEMVKTGYITGYFTITSIGGITTANQNGSISPNNLMGEGIRIQLTWGATPYDLDSHLTGPNGADGRFHVYFSNKSFSFNEEKIADLDVDDTSSYGPETVTIYKQISGLYRYSIHDYSNGGSTDSSALANSGAKVTVYQGSQVVSTFDVPNSPGTLWTVFELSGTTITPINTMDCDYSSFPSIRTSIVESKHSDSELLKSLPPKR